LEAGVSSFRSEAGVILQYSFMEVGPSLIARKSALSNFHFPFFAIFSGVYRDV
jgi:hypothetical protein